MALECTNVVGKGKARRACGHPLGLHDPCSAEGCPCRRFEPRDVKRRAAMITDIAPDPGAQAQAERRAAALTRGLR